MPSAIASVNSKVAISFPSFPPTPLFALHLLYIIRAGARGTVPGLEEGSCQKMLMIIN